MKLGVQLKLIPMVIISLDKDCGATVVQNVKKNFEDVFQLDDQQNRKNRKKHTPANCIQKLDFRLE